MLFPVSASDPVPVLEGMDEDMGFSLPPVLAEESEESAPQPQPRRRVCTHANIQTHVTIRNVVLVYCVVTVCVFVFQGNKRRAVEEGSDLASSSSSHLTDRCSEGRSLPLKARYGINAWKRWALSPSDQSDDAKVKDRSKPGELNRVMNLLPWLIVDSRV